jgi:hypothetical protein
LGCEHLERSQKFVPCTEVLQDDVVDSGVGGLLRVQRPVGRGKPRTPLDQANWAAFGRGRAL